MTKLYWPAKGRWCHYVITCMTPNTLLRHSEKVSMIFIYINIYKSFFLIYVLLHSIHVFEKVMWLDRIKADVASQIRWIYVSNSAARSQSFSKFRLHFESSKYSESGKSLISAVVCQSIRKQITYWVLYFIIVFFPFRHRRKFEKAAKSLRRHMSSKEHRMSFRNSR